MEINNSCSVVSDSNGSSEQLMRGIIVSTFECGEVAAIIFRKYQDPLYLVPRKLLDDSNVTIADGMLKCRDEVCFKVDHKGIVDYIEEGTGGIYFTNFISDEKVATVAIFSTGSLQKKKTWTVDFGIVSSIHENLKVEMQYFISNVPFDAELTWKITLGCKQDPSFFKIVSFKPTISFSLFHLASVNVSHLNLVSRAPWNASLKPLSIVKEQQNDDWDFSALAVPEHSKVEKELSCFVVGLRRMYCHSRHEYVLIANRSSIKRGSLVLADVFWSDWNRSFVAVQLKPVKAVNTSKYNRKDYMFSVEIDSLRFGLYQSIELGFVSDPLCILQRLRFSKPFFAWVKHSKTRIIYPAFSVVGLVNEADYKLPKIGLIRSCGFIKDIYGSVHALHYPSLRFYFKADVVGNFTVGRFITFDAEFDEETGFFWITSAKLNLQPARLIVGDFKKGFVFRASFTAAIGNLVRNEDIGFVEDKHRQLNGNVGANTFWFMFKRKVESVVHCHPLNLDRKNHSQFQTDRVPEREFTPEMYDEMEQFLNASLSITF